MKPKGRIALSFAFMGSLGSASLVLMMFVLNLYTFRDFGGDTPAGIALIGGLILMTAVALWVIGMIGILLVLRGAQEVKHGWKAKVSYVLECVLPVLLLLPFVILLFR